MCFKNARRNPCNFTGSGQLLIFLDRMVDSNSNTLRNVMKADITLGNSGAFYCWPRQVKDAFDDLQNDTVYRSDLLHCRKLNISNLHIDIIFRHQTLWREAHGQEHCSQKSLWLITTGLFCLRDRFLMHVHHLSCRGI